MLKIITRFTAVALISALPSMVCAETKTDNSSIEPGKVHEVCMNLTEGQNLIYFFKSTQKMNFNIHYHEGEKVTFPVEEYPTNMGSDVFTAPLEQGYCMMWTNIADEAVDLDVSYEVQ